jgi:hypothetical protein
LAQATLIEPHLLADITALVIGLMSLLVYLLPAAALHL